MNQLGGMVMQVQDQPAHNQPVRRVLHMVAGTLPLSNEGVKTSLWRR